MILLGFKGVGKTSYGRKLARLLRWEFVDTDDLITDLYVELGHDYKTVYEIHQTMGEKKFRKLESEAIKSLREKEKRILSIGGGTLLDSENVQLLKKLGKFVYLSKDKEDIKIDLQSGKIPSFLESDDFEKAFDTMYNERLSIYQSLADYTVNTSSCKEAEVLAKLYEIAFKS